MVGSIRRAASAAAEVFDPALLITAAALLLLLASRALGHGEADWINDGGYRNGANEFCCGEIDCKPLATGAVAHRAAGYFIFSRQELVPESEVLASVDGRYWLCQSGGKRKCLFVPPESQ